MGNIRYKKYLICVLFLLLIPINVYAYDWDGVIADGSTMTLLGPNDQQYDIMVVSSDGHSLSVEVEVNGETKRIAQGETAQFGNMVLGLFDWGSGESLYTISFSSSVEVTSTDDGSSKVCNLYDHKECYNGYPYWYDSCGYRQDRAGDCGYGYECVNGECIVEGPACEDKCNFIGQSCINNNIFKCVKNHQGCKEPDLVQNCASNEECVQSGSTVYCKTKFVCSEGDKKDLKCISETMYAYYVCKNNNWEWVKENCPTSDICKDGKCVEVVEEESTYDEKVEEVRDTTENVKETKREEQVPTKKCSWFERIFLGCKVVAVKIELKKSDECDREGKIKCIDNGIFQCINRNGVLGINRVETCSENEVCDDSSGKPECKIRFVCKEDEIKEKYCSRDKDNKGGIICSNNTWKNFEERCPKGTICMDGECGKCDPKWVCEDIWSECIDNLKKKKCVDNCGNIKYESKVCLTSEQTNTKKGLDKSKIVVDDYPLILVHGWHSDDSALWELLRKLIEDGFYEFHDYTKANEPKTKPWVANPVTYAHGSSGRIDTNISKHAEWLKYRIEQTKEFTKRDKVNIIAHSMGGLISRYYIKYLGGDKSVNKLIILDTPNHGAYLVYQVLLIY